MKLSLTSSIIPPLLLTASLLSPIQTLPNRPNPPFPFFFHALQNHNLLKAQNKWRADTSTVSHFLSSAPSLLQKQQQKQSGADLAAAAKIALDAENDELSHKEVIDEILGSGGNGNGEGGNTNADERIAAADDVLVGQGTFQTVVDALERFAKDGDGTMTPDEAAALLQDTNAVRCGKVLPAIDTYFRVVGERLGLKGGDVLVATRPTNC